MERSLHKWKKPSGKLIRQDNGFDLERENFKVSGVQPEQLLIVLCINGQELKNIDCAEKNQVNWIRELLF